MYYYGYNGGYANQNSMYYNSYPGYYSSGYSYGAAFILVLFILLVIIFGVGFVNNNNFENHPPKNHCCGN